MFVAAVQKWPVAGALAIFGLVVSALFVLRVVQQSFFGPEREEWAGMPDMGNFMSIPRVILASTLLLFGFAPFLMLDKLSASVNALVKLLEAAP